MKLEIYDSNDLNFVELNYTGGNDTYIRCDKESVYIDSIVFNLFSPCFESANKLYEYYGPTKYNARKIIPLRNELLKQMNTLKGFTSAGALEDYLNLHFLGKEFIETLSAEIPNWKMDWKGIIEKLIVINKRIIELTEKCADEEKILWVVGY